MKFNYAMKFFTYLMLSIILIFATSCGKDDAEDSVIINSGLVGTWNLINTSGGFAGINCSYQLGEIVFVFDEDDNLTITNNVINTSATCGGQEINISVQTHTYGVLNDNGKKYLLVDDQESGELMVENDRFTLDQNNSSQGSGADLFMLTFVK